MLIEIYIPEQSVDSTSVVNRLIQVHEQTYVLPVTGHHTANGKQSYWVQFPMIPMGVDALGGSGNIHPDKNKLIVFWVESGEMEYATLEGCCFSEVNEYPYFPGSGMR